MKNKSFLLLAVCIMTISLVGCTNSKKEKANFSDGKILYIYKKTFDLGTADKVIIATYNSSTSFIEKHYFYYKKAKLLKLNYEYIFPDIKSATDYYNSIITKDNYQLLANTVMEYNVKKTSSTKYEDVIEELKNTLSVSRVEVRFNNK